MRFLLVIIVALLLVPVANAGRHNTTLSWDGSTVSGCGYTAGDADVYFLWYPTGDPKGDATYTETEVAVDGASCISTAWTPPGNTGYVEIWVIQENKAGKGAQVMGKITITLG
jgi:hypothetical protein